MMQSRLGSFVEAIANVAIGYAIAVATQVAVFPLFGIETAFSDALAQELEPFGIGVALIEPGAIDTEIWETSTARSRDMLAAMPEEARERYADMVEDTLKVGERSARLAISPDRVVKVIIDVLTARHPRPRNLVGIDAKAAGLVARLPTELRTPILKQVL